MKRIITAALLFTIGAAAQAQAYTTYLKPADYWPDAGEVHLQGSHASQFFTPQIALPPTFTATGPDNSVVVMDRIAVETTATSIVADLPALGTYRISTGEQRGPVTTLIGLDGQWRPAAPGELAPEGALTTTLQTVTVADVYVSRGRSTRSVVDQTIGRLAIRPITHPNQVLASSGLEVEVLFDGAPMANTAVVLYAAGDLDTDVDTFVVTDAQGRARFTLPAPGHYLIAARHRADAPAGSAAQVQSYTTTLTFEARAALHEEVPAPPEPERRRRRRD